MTFQLPISARLRLVDSADDELHHLHNDSDHDVSLPTLHGGFGSLAPSRHGSVAYDSERFELSEVTANIFLSSYKEVCCYVRVHRAAFGTHHTSYGLGGGVAPSTSMPGVEGSGADFGARLDSPMSAASRSLATSFAPPDNTNISSTAVIPAPPPRSFPRRPAGGGPRPPVVPPAFQPSSSSTSQLGSSGRPSPAHRSSAIPTIRFFLCCASEAEAPTPQFHSTGDPVLRSTLQDGRFLRLPFRDASQTVLKQHFQSAFDFIDWALGHKNRDGSPRDPASGPPSTSAVDPASNAGSKILIYCQRGMSRSPSVVIGYLMSRRGFSYEDANALVRQSRAVADPNATFVLQLQSDGCNAENPSNVDDHNLERSRSPGELQRADLPIAPVAATSSQDSAPPINASNSSISMPSFLSPSSPSSQRHHHYHPSRGRVTTLVGITATTATAAAVSSSEVGAPLTDSAVGDDDGFVNVEETGGDDDLSDLEEEEPSTVEQLLSAAEIQK